jgi:hypothetical protein
MCGFARNLGYRLWENPLVRGASRKRISEQKRGLQNLETPFAIPRSKGTAAASNALAVAKTMPSNRLSIIPITYLN